MSLQLFLIGKIIYFGCFSFRVPMLKPVPGCARPEVTIAKVIQMFSYRVPMLKPVPGCARPEVTMAEVIQGEVSYGRVPGPGHY